jgi:preprotein translocase subunit SecA
MYGKLAGMTGTADTEAYEFQEIYGLETVVIPPNKPMIRKDENDLVYKTAKEKYDAVIADIRDCHERGQPVLVGTTSIENSELLSQLLTQAKLPHQVLNAKQHAGGRDRRPGRPPGRDHHRHQHGRPRYRHRAGRQRREAGPVPRGRRVHPRRREGPPHPAAQGRMAGLNAQVKAAGGLRIIATERHESRRIDNQLRGRAGRQGDPGSSRFYLSLDDPLMRIFAGDRVRAIMDRLKMPEGEAIEAGIVTAPSNPPSARSRPATSTSASSCWSTTTSATTSARSSTSSATRSWSRQPDRADHQPAQATMTEVVRTYVPADSLEEQWDLPAWRRRCARSGSSRCRWCHGRGQRQHHRRGHAGEGAGSGRRRLPGQAGPGGRGAVQALQRMVLLQSIDTHWREHLAALDYLRQGIHLRGYAQKNPKQEYKREAFELFAQLLDVVKMEVTRVLMTVRVQTQEQVSQAAEALEDQAERISNVSYIHPTEDGGVSADPAPQAVAAGDEVPRVGRNDPCPCGSGKKYKSCHGRLA